VSVKLENPDRLRFRLYAGSNKVLNGARREVVVWAISAPLLSRKRRVRRWPVSFLEAIGDRSEATLFSFFPKQFQDIRCPSSRLPPGKRLEIVVMSAPFFVSAGRTEKRRRKIRAASLGECGFGWNSSPVDPVPRILSVFHEIDFSSTNKSPACLGDGAAHVCKSLQSPRMLPPNALRNGVAAKSVENASRFWSQPLPPTIRKPGEGCTLRGRKRCQGLFPAGQPAGFEFDNWQLSIQPVRVSLAVISASASLPSPASLHLKAILKSALRPFLQTPERRGKRKGRRNQKPKPKFFVSGISLREPRSANPGRFNSSVPSRLNITTFGGPPANLRPRSRSAGAVGPPFSGGAGPL